MSEQASYLAINWHNLGHTHGLKIDVGSVAYHDHTFHLFY